MTCAEALAGFVTRKCFDDLSDRGCSQLKIRILDSLGCAVAAMNGEPIKMLREQILEPDGVCTCIGGGRTAADRAAFYNGALVRYLDFNDSYLAKGETCHPSDNLAPVLAATEYANGTGRDLLTALAVAYQVQCRLCDTAPVRAAGFDHTTQGAYAVAAGVSKALGLNATQTTNAIAICGASFNALRVTRTGKLSHWKGLAYPNTAACCTFATFLAMRGITGPWEVFEGEKGFMDAIAGVFRIDWLQEGLGRVMATILKRHNAEIHSQTAIECALRLKSEEKFDASEIERIDVETFDVAFNIIGGGEEGDKTSVSTKEEADHSLPYLVSVALLDGQVMPEQYAAERILRPDVQTMLHRVSVHPIDAFSDRFPDEMPCRLTLSLRDGRVLSKELRDYSGFTTQPMSWEIALEKFERIAGCFVQTSLQRSIADSVKNLESIQVRELTRLLQKVETPQPEHAGKSPRARKEV
ncbi:MAG: MmgE/PrpD family protein [Candidatus Acidiferrales bacterium]